MVDVASNPSDAVELALDLYGNDILRLAFSFLKRREDAEDIVQDTLIRFMQSGGVFENEEQMKAWLLRVAANLCRDYLKSAEKKKTVALPEGYDVAAEELLPEGESEVLKAVMALPEKYRSAIHLYYYEEYSTKEIAEILSKKEVTVRSLLKRGREKLENMMKGDRDYAKRI
ncbi:MAG: sigma-70 family RNA polymerase sigma factor [Lachnospiraceae bacterium]|nr:sigma-70 family RNA polymerase sigma factor [Lachnospiraceae bacterium]